MSFRKSARDSWRTATPEDAEPASEKSLIWRVWRFFSRDIWQHDLAQLNRATRYLYKTARVLYLASRGIVQDNCVFRAMALTYITVLSLVPLLAFSFSVAKGFGFYEKLLHGTINPFLDETFAGSPEMRSALARVLEFVNQTDVSQLGWPGLALLVYTVIRLLSTIERSFNDIWSVHRSRNIMRKIADYLAMVIVTPIFLFVATAVTLAAQNNAMVAYLRKSLGIGPVIDLVLGLVPLVSMWFGFAFVYMAMPNTRTKLSSALLGGLVAALMWQAALVLHIQFQLGIARYNALYSSFAAIPIFLMWMNICWVVVLFGAEVCFAHQSEESYVHVARSRPANHALKEVVALRTMTRIVRTFLVGGEPWTATRLATELSIPQKPVQEVLGDLVERGLLAEVEQDQETAFVPARDPASTTVKSVLDALKGTVRPEDVPAGAAVDDEIDRLMSGLDRESRTSRFNLTLRELAEAAQAHSADAPSTAAADAGVIRTTG